MVFHTCIMISFVNYIHPSLALQSRQPKTDETDALDLNKFNFMNNTGYQVFVLKIKFMLQISFPVLDLDMHTGWLDLYIQYFTIPVDQDGKLIFLFPFGNKTMTMGVSADHKIDTCLIQDGCK